MTTNVMIGYLLASIFRRGPLIFLRIFFKSISINFFYSLAGTMWWWGWLYWLGFGCALASFIIIYVCPSKGCAALGLGITGIILCSIFLIALIAVYVVDAVAQASWGSRGANHPLAVHIDKKSEATTIPMWIW